MLWMAVVSVNGACLYVFVCVCRGGVIWSCICMLTAGCVHAVGHVCAGPTASGFPMKNLFPV